MQRLAATPAWCSHFLSEIEVHGLLAEFPPCSVVTQDTQKNIENKSDMWRILSSSKRFKRYAAGEMKALVVT
jgi:hypothetical protein